MQSTFVSFARAWGEYNHCGFMQVDTAKSWLEMLLGRKVEEMRERRNTFRCIWLSSWEPF